MKSFVVVGCLAIIALVAFQNCNKGPGANGVNESVSPSATTTRTEMPMANIAKINFYVQDVKVVTKASNSFSVKYTKTLQFDMQTGQLTESNDINSGTITYCLPSEVKAELVSILESSQICQSTEALAPDQVCTAQYITPYCEMDMGGETMALGSATDGCGSNATDLCDSQAEVLKAFIDKLNNNYTDYRCGK